MSVHAQRHDVRLLPAAALAWAVAAAAVGLPLRLVGAVVVTLLVLALASWWVARRRWRDLAAQVLLAAAAAALVGVSITAGQVTATAGAISQLIAEQASVQVTAVVAAAPRQVDSAFGTNYLVTVRVLEITGRNLTSGSHAHLIVWGDQEWAQLHTGQRLEVSGRLKPVAGGQRPLAELRPTGAPVVVGQASGLDRIVAAIRTTFPAALTYAPADTAALMQGIALGNDAGLSPAVAAAMRTTSLTHLTAVSGTHFAIIAGALMAVGIAAGWPLWGRLALTGVGLAALMAVVGPEPSVLRGGTMAAIGLAGILTGRGRAASTALCAAVITLVVVDPWLARSVGFILSVVATAALIVVALPLAQVLARRLPRTLAVGIAVPITAQVACTPVLLMLNPYLATYGVLANLLALPAVAIATMCGVLAALVAPVFLPLATLISLPAALAATWIRWVATTASSWPLARFPWPGGWPGVGWLLGLGLAVVAVCVWWRVAGSRGRVMLVATVVAAAVLVYVLRPRLVIAPGWDVIACDVGQGSTTLVNTSAGAVLVDTGPPAGNVAACLRSAGVQQVALVILTHPHADHVGALDQILATATVSQALVAPIETPTAATVRSQLEAAGVVVHVASAGWQGVVGEVGWQVLWPPPALVTASDDYGDNGAINDSSLAVRFTWSNGLTLITLGDLEQTGQDRLVASAPGPLTAHILVVAHHGSRSQSHALTTAIGAAIALISVGENSYGHPHARTLEMLLPARVLRTDQCGTIALAAVAGGVAVSGCG